MSAKLKTYMEKELADAIDHADDVAPRDVVFYGFAVSVVY